MSFSGPLLALGCPEPECRCDICHQKALLVLEYGCLPQRLARFCLCHEHLCELATDAPLLLAELLGRLVDLVTLQGEAMPGSGAAIRVRAS